MVHAQVDKAVVPSTLSTCRSRSLGDKLLGLVPGVRMERLRGIIFYLVGPLKLGTVWIVWIGFAYQLVIAVHFTIVRGINVYMPHQWPWKRRPRQCEISMHRVLPVLFAIYEQPPNNDVTVIVVGPMITFP